MLKRRDVLKSAGAAVGLLLGSASGIFASAPPATPQVAELAELADEDTHPAHWDYVYNCPRCGERCDNDRNCVASTTPQICDYNGEYEWDETIRCDCGETWEVDV